MSPALAGGFITTEPPGKPPSQSVPVGAGLSVLGVGRVNE